jgi:hypothetical protein
MSLVHDLGADPACPFKRSTFGAAVSDCVVAVHLILATIEVIGSLWSRRLSATCNAQSWTT